jgi:hypothetical protein
MAGGILAKKLDGAVAYVLDARVRADEGQEIIDQATQLGVEVIDRGGFEKLLETSPFDNIDTTHGDARQFVMRKVQRGELGQYDIIYGDAFNDFSVPAHLTTLEFNLQLAELLKDDGIFMANIIDIWTVSKFMGAYRNTLAKAFDHVYLLQSDKDEPSETRSTFVLVCVKGKPIELRDLGDREGDLPYMKGYVMEGDILQPVLRGGLKPIGVHVASVTEDQRRRFDLGRKCRNVGVRIAAGSHLTLMPDKDFSIETIAKPELRINEFFELDRADRISVTMYGAANNIVGSRVFSAESSNSRGRYSVRHDYDELHPDCVTANVVRILGRPRTVHDRKYKLVDEQIVEFSEDLPQESKVEFTLYGDEEIILTDDFSPVDNMLAEVIATRID